MYLITKNKNHIIIIILYGMCALRMEAEDEEDVFIRTV